MPAQIPRSASSDHRRAGAAADGVVESTPQMSRGPRDGASAFSVETLWLPGRGCIHLARMSTHESMAALAMLVQRAHILSTVGDLLGWDEQVNLPPGAAEQRAAQHAVLAEVQHTAATNPRIGELLDEL